MSDAMSQLYQQVILDHAKERHGEGTLTTYAAESFQVNPTCGDEVRLRLAMGHDGAPRIAAVGWQGQGCSISQASLSVMTDLVTGRSVAEVDEIAEAFRDLMHQRGAEPAADAVELLGDAAAFTGVARFPARVKCGLLGWMALRDALAKALTEPLTEPLPDPMAQPPPGRAPEELGDQVIERGSRQLADDGHPRHRAPGMVGHGAKKEDES